MGRDKKLTKAHHQFITDTYLKLSKEGFNHEQICEKLRTEYYQFLKSRTIYSIVAGDYKKR